MLVCAADAAKTGDTVGKCNKDRLGLFVIVKSLLKIEKWAFVLSLREPAGGKPCGQKLAGKRAVAQALEVLSIGCEDLQEIISSLIFLRHALPQVDRPIRSGKRRFQEPGDDILGIVV